MSGFSLFGRNKDTDEPQTFALFVESLFGMKEKDGGDADDVAVAKLAGDIDVDKIGQNFGKFAGADNVMDREEFDRFTKETNITRAQAGALWSILDADGSGLVEKTEFSSALRSLQEARAWLRYCPECGYSNTCDYCQECNANCDECSEHVFCAAHWADHPSRNIDDEVDEEGALVEKHAFGSAEFFRRHLVIRPLNWAYTSKATAWLPVKAKSGLRQALRSQQLAAEEATAAALAAEQAALAQRPG